MRWQQAIALSTWLFLGAARCVAAVQPHANDSQNEDVAPQIADAFESIIGINMTAPLDDVVVQPALLESRKAEKPQVVEEAHDVEPVTIATTEHHMGDLSLSFPHEGTLVAIEAAALLVVGVTMLPLVVAKIKARSSINGNDYDKDSMDQMLQSLLHSDMDYAAI